MNASDTELLRQFARDGSEAAFAELVRRHVDLVYSAALRQVGFDVQAAEDVTQAVFADLARKAASQTRLSTLAGWLYGSTRYEAMLHRRTESRRIVRETAAHAMSQLLTDTDPEPEWERLQPVLDEAMCDLPEDDRDAVLLRYFEKRPLAEIGLKLGLSENTARMRVDRALDRLHAALKKRGITSTAAAVGMLVGAHAVASAPAEVTGRVARAAAGSWQPRRTVLAAGRGWLGPAVVALLLGVVGLIWVNRREWFGTSGASDLAAATSEGLGTNPSDAGVAIATVGQPAIGQPASGSDADGTGEDQDAGPFLLLKVLTKDTGQPVPNVAIESTSTALASQEDRDKNPRLSFKHELHTASTLRSGEARVRYLAKSERLEIALNTEGFAGAVVRWFPERGDTIPTNFTVRLERGVPIGGRVVDTSGKRIYADLQIGARDADTGTKSGESLMVDSVSVSTDDDGRWRTSRVRKSALMRLGISVRTYEFLEPNLTEIGLEPEMLKALRDQTHVIVLKKGHVIRGLVADPSGNPIAGATVVFSGLQGGQVFKREETSENGTFSIPGADSGAATLCVIARGYPPKTVSIDVTDKMEPVQVVIDSGSPMRLRLVDQAGDPVFNAAVEPTTTDPYSMQDARRLWPLFQQRSDQDGRVFWAAAPVGKTLLNIFTTQYLEERCVTNIADGIEREMVLIKPPVVRGRVIDSATGAPVPKFILAIGYEEPAPEGQKDRARFFVGDQFEKHFTGGTFHHVVKRRINVLGTRQRRFPIRLKAEGYRTFVSEPIPYDAGEVTLDAALERTSEIEVTVLDPAGRPAADAELAAARLGGGLRLRSGHLVLGQRDADESILRTGADGKLSVDLEGDADRLVIAHASGYAETTSGALAADPVIRLRRWGRIEGLHMPADGVAGTVSVIRADAGAGDSHLEIRTASDAAGKFEIAEVPPYPVHVRQIVSGPPGSGPSSTSILRAIDVVIEAGETKQISFAE